MARWLVTGGAGFIGSHVVEGLRDDSAPGRALILRRWALSWLGAGMLFCGCQEATTPTTTPIPTPVDSADTERREHEQEALTAFYRATNGPDWTNNTGWLTDAPLGEWHGVVVDDDGGVTGLRLPENQLSGEIPPELASLASLTVLELRGNQLSGEIPTQLASLANLTVLELGGNQLSGEIPPELASLANLTVLDLRVNELSGEIPPQLASLANLTALNLQRNQLSGEIPPELAGLADLEGLRLFANQLSGEIPGRLGNLANLTVLNLSRNQLSGEIPRELGYPANLEVLRLFGNQLSGEIPGRLGNLASLRVLDLSRNQLSGEIPRELGFPANLEVLRLSDNQLSGEIPRWSGYLASLTLLDLSQNQLSGELPPWLGGLANLTDLRLNENQLSGEIPYQWRNLSNLQRLWLHNNELGGPIPQWLDSLRNLTDLRIEGNSLRTIWSGPLPARVGPVAPVTSGPPPAVELVEAFGGRQFRQPTEIGVYPVGPGGADSGAFVAEREGLIMLLRPGSAEAVELIDLRDRVAMDDNEDGLLSVALDPRFEQNGHLWVYYSASGLPRVTRLSRFTVAPDDLLRVDPGSELVVIEVGQPTLSHNGGAIRFGRDEMLYLGLGDGQAGGADPLGHGQNPGTLLGSVIRIDVRDASTRSPYAVPPDNPFVSTPGARPEIWAYGLRNPWRMAFDPATGALWAGDVGSNEVEEIDRIEAGGNYGWNRFEGTRCTNREAGCDPEGTTLPVVVYGHHLGCSVTGGVVYRGKEIPALVGHYLFADYCRGQVWALPPDGGDVAEITVSPRSVSSFAVDDDGEVYVLTFWGAAFQIALSPP